MLVPIYLSHYIECVSGILNYENKYRGAPVLFGPPVLYFNNFEMVIYETFLVIFFWSLKLLGRLGPEGGHFAIDPRP